MSAKRQEAQNTKKSNKITTLHFAVCRAGNFSTESKRDSLSTREVCNDLDEEEEDDDDEEENEEVMMIKKRIR